MNFYRLPEENNNSGIRFWVGFLLTLTLMSALGLGWIINSLVIFLLFLLILPIVALFGLQWWAQSRVVTAACPVCQQTVTAFKGNSFACPSCGEPLEIEGNQFIRLTPAGTIDIEVQTIE